MTGSPVAELSRSYAVASRAMLSHRTLKAVSFIPSGPQIRSDRAGPKDMPVARATSTPVTLAAVSYIQRSPGSCTSGSMPSRRIHSSDEGGPSASSASAIGTARLRNDHAGAKAAGQQVPQRYRAFRRNGVLQRPVRIDEHGHLRKLREEVVDWVIETESAVLDERHRTRRDDRLRHRAHAADRVARHRRSRPGTVERESARRFDVNLAVPGQDRHHTRNDSGVDLTIQQAPHPSQSFCREAIHSHLSRPSVARGIARVGLRSRHHASIVLAPSSAPWLLALDRKAHRGLTTRGAENDRNWRGISLRRGDKSALPPARVRRACWAADRDGLDASGLVQAELVAVGVGKLDTVRQAGKTDRSEGDESFRLAGGVGGDQVEALPIPCLLGFDLRSAPCVP